MTVCYIALNINYSKFNFTIPSHMNFLCQVYNFYLGIVFVNIAVGANVIRPCIGADANRINVGADANRINVGADATSTNVGADANSINVGASYASPGYGNNRNSIWLLIFAIPTILFFYFYKQIINIPDNFKTTIVVVAIIISFYIFENVIANNEVLKNIINKFNNISYEFFLVHHFIIYQVDFMLNYQRLDGMTTLGVIIIDLLLTIIFAIIVNIISKQVYKIKWIK